jgi:hypothetical protein
MFFKLPWFKKAPTPTYQHTELLELDFLVDEFHAAMADIDDPLRSRLHAALMIAQHPKDLWFLRSKIFNLVSKHHCESEANRRIARLDEKLQFFVEHHPDYSPEEIPSRPMTLH